MNLSLAQQVPRRNIVLPSSPKQLAFRVRKRGLRTHTGGVSRLLIVNRFGVWSVVHHRYIRRTRYNCFCALAIQAKEVRTLMAEADEMGMRQWPEYDEVRPLHCRVAGIFWALKPAWTKGKAIVQRYRRMQARRRADAAELLRRKRLVKRALILALPAMETAVLGLALLRDMLVSDSYSAWACLAYAAWSM
ncbi:hypothetical protein E2562_001584 [Oryza meyeriana var. granulata]|uniref:Uncharacterized protein n=1 Tax=Oryza meyeriana var. granulata TaxID=110450 RepID=A0A6G1CBK1_9ORYZ|nr:hypothetical protein E2562_001584 [Oryza meyeriana var. granulata]